MFNALSTEIIIKIENIVIDLDMSSSSKATEAETSVQDEKKLADSLYVPFQIECQSKSLFEDVWKDARRLEEEIDALKWLARRKELEWDCTRQMIDKKKLNIKEVKKIINMVRTVNDLGPQLNVDSDDDDTPYEDSSSSDDEEIDNEEDGSDLTSSLSQKVPYFVRQPSPKRQRLWSGGDEGRFVLAEVTSSVNHFTTGHLCLTCKEKPPQFVCSLCKNHWYCSMTCQIDDWPSHQKECSGCTDNTSKRNKGDGNFNLIKFPLSKDLIEFVQKNSPNNVVAKRESQSTKCLNCHQNYPYFLCSECRNHWYCSNKCHQEHWDHHRPFCLSH